MLLKQLYNKSNAHCMEVMMLVFLHLQATDRFSEHKPVYICMNCRGEHNYLLLCHHCNWSGCEYCANINFENDKFVCPICSVELHSSVNPSRFQ